LKNVVEVSALAIVVARDCFGSNSICRALTALMDAVFAFVTLSIVVYAVPCSAISAANLIEAFTGL
jgi:hypothetical protein